MAHLETSPGTLRRFAWSEIGMARPLAFVALLGAACSPAPAPTASSSPSVDTADPQTSAAAGEPNPAPEPGAAEAPEPCGELGCLRFASAEAAFRHLLAEKPLILAVGEAHAQKGTEKIASATERFRNQLLPLVAGDASDIVLELMVSEGKCGASEKQVAEKVEKPVTEKQADTNKSEFVLLAEEANRLGVRPHVLRPSCEDYLAVANAGAEGVPRMLTMIADLSRELVMRILERNERTGVTKTVLAYGGALHNDLDPAPGREAWSFGPALAELSAERYVAVDLIVPEYIKDNDSWRSLPWYPHYDAAAAGDRVTLFRPRPRSYVLIFAPSAGQ